VSDKYCASCGRRIEWRKKWARDWDDVRYCSDACRGQRVSAVDRELEAAIVRLLGARGAGKTICRAARRLVAAGKIVVTQGGRVVDASTAKGPIRLRRP
jgi:hypothetical protein